MALIAIHPGTDEWRVWLAYHRGTKTEARMLCCLRDMRPFHVRTRMPPVLPDLDATQLSPAKRSILTTDASKGRSRSVNAIADKLEDKAARDEAERDVATRGRKADKKRAAIADEAFTAVQGGRKPDLSGHDALGVVHVVDPFEEAKASSKGHGAPPPLPKLVALRDDPVGQMHKRGQLDGDAQGVADVRLKAARYLQALYEIVEIGGAKAMDPGKPVISGGKPCEPDIDARRYAAKRLIEIEADLAKRDKALLRLVLWQKMSLHRVAAMYGVVRQNDIRGLSFQFRACLDIAAEHVGIQHTASGARRRRDAMDAMASYASDPKLYAAVHRAKYEG